MAASGYRLGRTLKSGQRDTRDYITYLTSIPGEISGGLPGPGGAGAWQTVAQWAANNLGIASGANFPAFNARIVLDKSLFPATTTKLRLSFDGPVDATTDVSAVNFAAAVGLAASGGNAWDYASAPANLTFGGNPSTPLTYVLAGAEANRFVSDIIPLVIDGTKDIVVSMLYDSGSTGTSENTGVEPPNTWHLYLNAGGGAVGDLAPAGLIDVRSTFGNNHQWALSKVEAFA